MAIELPTEGGAVDRGTPVTLTAVFDGEADQLEVYASFIRPQESRAVVDPGFGNTGSRIRRLDADVFTYVIDTTGFLPGKVQWHIWSPERGSKFGWFLVNDAPPQLL